MEQQEAQTARSLPLRDHAEQCTVQCEAAASSLFVLSYDGVMRGTGVDHFDLVVSSLDRSLALYRELLRPLGYTRAVEIVGERGERVVYLSGAGIVPFSLREAQTLGGHDRYRIGLHHVAFEAPSREVVDERLRWARAQGLEIENDPKDYTHRPGYYAGFFYDPDGIKLEILHVPD